MSHTPLAHAGFMLILSSPSGAGKTTISRLLLEKDPHLMMSVSATTRPMRPGEVEGKDYFFISDEAFSAMKQKDEFLEYAHVFGKSYGTPRQKVMETLLAGKDVLFDIDWQGTMQLTQHFKEKTVSIFILPPDMKELENRLRRRAQDSDEVVASRMSKAAEEISHWNEYDYVVVNHSIESCLNEVAAILTAERLKRSRQVNLEGFVGELLGN